MSEEDNQEGQYSEEEQQAYLRSLGYLSQILARLARDLPGYEGDRDIEMLGRFDLVSEEIVGIGARLDRSIVAIEDLHRWAGEARGREQCRLDSFDETYRRSILDTLDYVELLGVEVHKACPASEALGGLYRVGS